MNKKLIHLKNDLNSLKRSYILCLILVLSFGVYKNIICLFGSDVSIPVILSKLLFILLGFGVGVLKDYLKHKKITFGFNALTGFIIGMIIPFNTNLIIFLLSLSLIFLIDIFDKEERLNKICLIKLVCIVLLLVFQNYTYLNPLEGSNEYAYTLVDIFIGNQVGGIFSTSVLLILISLIILSLNKLYKSKIAVVSLTSYLLVLLVLLITKDYMNIFKIMLNSSNIFAFVFIAPFSIYSPYKPKEVIIYSLCVGVFSALISYFLVLQEGATIAILIVNIFIILFAKFHKTTNNA